MQTVLTVAVAGLAVVALVPLQRFRRAGPVQRQQLKWFAFVVGGCFASLLAAVALVTVLPGAAGGLVAVASAGGWSESRSRSEWRSCVIGCTTSTG